MQCTIPNPHSHPLSWVIPFPFAIMDFILKGLRDSAHEWLDWGVRILISRFSSVPRFPQLTTLPWGFSAKSSPMEGEDGGHISGNLYFHVALQPRTLM